MPSNAKGRGCLDRVCLFAGRTVCGVGMVTETYSKGNPPLSCVHLHSVFGAFFVGGCTHRDLRDGPEADNRKSMVCSRNCDRFVGCLDQGFRHAHLGQIVQSLHRDSTGTSLGAIGIVPIYSPSRLFGDDVCFFGICRIHIVINGGGSQSDGVLGGVYLPYERGGTDDGEPIRGGVPAVSGIFLAIDSACVLSSTRDHRTSPSS